MAAQQQASAANRRLAQQLANRPGLGMGDFSQMQQPMGMNMPMNNQMMPPQQRSLKQRLGKANVKARLNLEAVGRGGMQPRGRGGFPRGGRFPRGRGQAGGMQMRGRGGGGPRGGQSASPRGIRGGRGRGSFRGRYQDDDFLTFSRRGRGQGGRDQRRGGRYQGDRFPGRGAGGRGARGAMRGQGPRGRGGMRGRGRGRGRGGGDSVSREQLDNQLDEYMSKTKSYLDSELDAYMAEANP